MQVILYMATTINGYIAMEDDNTDWVSPSDWETIKQMVKDCGVVVLGKRTYKIGIKENNFPYGDAVHIVMTTDTTLKSDSKEVIFTNKPPKAVIKLAESLGHKKMLIVGGSILNAAFLLQNLIDEIYLSVHPYLLGKGIPLFQPIPREMKLALVDVKKMEEDLVQLHYQVIK